MSRKVQKLKSLLARFAIMVDSESPQCDWLYPSSCEHLSLEERAYIKQLMEDYSEQAN